MSTQELQSYRLSSMEEPTDEMLHAIMEQVAESARQSSENVRMHKPTLCVIAGPNGSGKTTTTEQLLANEWGADSIYYKIR